MAIKLPGCWLQALRLHVSPPGDFPCRENPGRIIHIAMPENLLRQKATTESFSR